jgi:hypothetical protein
VVSRDELNAAAREELAALDRILAREPVDEQHLELAALVDSVRAGAPRMDPAFAERLESQIARRGERRSRHVPRIAGHGVRRIALAGGGLVAAAVAFTIVISSGVLNGNTRQPVTALQQTPGLSASGTASPHALATGTAKARGGAIAPKPGLSASDTQSGPAAATGSASLPSTNFSGSASGRLVHSDATLTLATSPATMQGVANQIVAATEHQGGVVQTSNVNIQGSSSAASFSLQVPSGHLHILISTLSALASVRALNQNTQDITDGYNQEQARLADNVAEHAALLKKLATAATVAQQTSIQQQLAKLQSRIAAEHRVIDRLLTQGRTAALQVTVVPGAGKRAAVGPFATAFNRSLHALEEVLAIALVVLAIVLPFALTALALWWGLTVVRQRARERAMRTA